jgi:hypothetical protein
MSSSSVKDLLFDHLAWANLSLADVEAISGALSEVVGPKFKFLPLHHRHCDLDLPTP